MWEICKCPAKPKVFTTFYRKKCASAPDNPFKVNSPGNYTDLEIALSPSAEKGRHAYLNITS